MSEGFLDGSAICLYIASACVGVYSKGEFVRIEVDRYTDFSDIKEKYRSNLQFSIFLGMNQLVIGVGYGGFTIDLGHLPQASWVGCLSACW